MTSRRGRVTVIAIAAVAVVVAGSLALLTGPASTAERTVADRRHDVWTWTPTTLGRGHFTASGARVNVDLVGVAVHHLRRDVVVKASYADLRRVGPRFGLTVDLRTDRHQGRHVSLVAGRSDNWRGRTILLGSRRREVACVHRHTRVSYARNAVWIVLPRRCLKNPRWVRFRVMAFKLVGEGRLQVDIAHRAGPTFRGWSRTVARR